MARGGKRGRPRAVNQPSPSLTPGGGGTSVAQQLEANHVIAIEAISNETVQTLMEQVAETPV